MSDDNAVHGSATTVMAPATGPEVGAVFEGDNVAWQRFVYSTLMRRDRSMVKGMDKTLARIKASLES